ncbi:chemotaxis protein CheB [Larkinella knui]|uniref:protein-glutamate methylesterase n=1 Tax=Larkinella knui TaxID=2025310 RepID=A0A3P1CXQ9_9BACT|nr:chemotaxis protein CheB [Larkinella knui]RRB18105.1 chemotaxis protein CheB [Larkinella knui]
MAKRDIVVIGSSAGGVYALRDFVMNFPADFPATIFIVQHLSPDTPSFLPDILTRAGKVKATHPKDGERFQNGRIYVAPPDHHLLIENDTVLVKKGPKENQFRPSIDALFRSAAYGYGPRVIGVVLTGLLNDGTSGMWSIKRLGGVSVIQHPEEALYPSMPESVRQNVEVDYTVAIPQLASLLGELIQQEVDGKPPLTELEEKRMDTELKIAAAGNAFEMNIMEEGELTSLTCPECHGSLVSIKEGRLLRFRCHTGHGFTSGSLLAGVTHSIEESLWNAVRSLEELVMLLEKTASLLEEAGDTTAAQEHRERAKRALERSRRVHDLVVG